MTLVRYAVLCSGAVAASLGSLLLAAGGRLEGAARVAAVFGAGLATLNTVTAYALVCWSSKRSPRAFLAAVLGGMVGRMAIMLVAVAAGIKGLGLPALPLTFALLGYFVLFLAVEIAILERRTTPAETR